MYIGILTLLTLAFWWPTRELPYWWDSAGFIMQAARFYLDTSFSSFILPSDSAISNMAHPPVFPFVLAFVWRMFGDSLYVSHLFYLPFVLIAVLFTYALGKHVAQTTNKKEIVPSSLVGFCAALLLLFSPLFLAQVGIIYLEIPVAGFAVMAVYFFLKRQILWYMLSATLMLLMKEVSVIIILAIFTTLSIQFVWNLFDKKRNKQTRLRALGKEFLIFGLPIIVILGWFVWHKIATGWIFVLPYYQNAMTEKLFTISFTKIFFVFQFFFIEQFRWVITFVVLAIIFILIIRHKIQKVFSRESREGLILFFIIIVLVPMLFGKLEFLPRYVVFGLPFLSIFFSFFLGVILQKTKIMFGAAVVLVLILFFLGWDNHQKITTWRFTPIEENLEYMDVIRVGKEMAELVEDRYPNSLIYTGFPTNYMLSQPFQGYVSKPLAVLDCTAYREGDRVDLIVFHTLSPSQLYCREMIRSLDFKPIEGFEHNGKWMLIYKAPKAE